MWPAQLSRIWCADWQAGNVEIVKSKMLFIGRGLKRDVPASFPAAGFIMEFGLWTCQASSSWSFLSRFQNCPRRGLWYHVVGTTPHPAWHICMYGLLFCEAYQVFGAFSVSLDALNDWTQHSQYIHIGSPRTRFGRCICCFKLRRRKVCFLLSANSFQHLF